jgi:hypothetical protein
MIVIFEIWSGNPLLIVESQKNFDWVCLNRSNFFFSNLFSTPEPREWWDNALEAL